MTPVQAGGSPLGSPPAPCWAKLGEVRGSVDNPGVISEGEVTSDIRGQSGKSSEEQEEAGPERVCL